MNVKPKTSARKAKTAAPAFEADLKRLEDLLQKLEHGDLPLEEALVAFEEGMHLVRRCNAKLDEVEQKVELLLRDEAGRLISQPFPIPAEGDE